MSSTKRGRLFRPERAACLNNHDTYNGVPFPTRSAQRRRNVFKIGGGGGGDFVEITKYILNCQSHASTCPRQIVQRGP